MHPSGRGRVVQVIQEEHDEQFMEADNRDRRQIRSGGGCKRDGIKNSQP